MTPADILDRAAGLIDEFGHCKNALVDYHGGYCVQGAILYAYRGAPSWPCGIDTNDLPGTLAFLERAHPSLIAAMRPLRKAINAPIVDWNNAPDRTKDEVTSTMRAVAATLRAQSAHEPAPELVTA